MKGDIRKPPISAVLALHKQGVRGACGWCGKEVTEKTEVRGWFKFWHAECSFEMGIIEQPALARDAVFARDKGICINCGEDWSEHFRLVPEFYVSEWRLQHATSENSTLGPDGKRLVHLHDQCFDTELPRDCREFFPYVSLKAISLWHVDHEVPLWKVEHMPPLERIEYFKLANLITRCEPCHKLKTAAEAAERAKFKRISKPKPDKPKRRWNSRPFGKSNGFPPRGSRPMRRKS